MDRKKFLSLCQKEAVIPKSEEVIYHDAKYHPFGINIWFDAKGCPHNTAILKDIKSNSLTYCELGEVNSNEY